MSEKTKYTAQELAEFKAIIIPKLKAAQEDVKVLKQDLDAREETKNDRKSDDDSTSNMSKEELFELYKKQDNHVKALQNALIRIENKTYGICIRTGKQIPKDRLKAIPYTTFCI